MTATLEQVPATSTKTKCYVQYGCSTCTPDGWLNFDCSPSFRLQRIPLLGRFAPGERPPGRVLFGDICRGLPVPDNSADAVYCSHVLEHLSLNDVGVALRNTYRILRPGGIFRFVLPDLHVLAQEYLDSNAPDAATSFMDNACLGVHDRARGLSHFLRSWLGNSKHLSMWDFPSMSAKLVAAGFTNIRKAALGDYPDELFARVEHPIRWDRLSFGVHCVKPGSTPAAGH